MCRLLPLVLVAAVALTACGGAADGGSGDRPLVVATTTQAADLVRNVAGDRAEVRGLIPANADPHDYELRPSDVEALAEADLIVRSGGDLDHWVADAVESAGSQAEVLNLIEHVETRRGGHAEAEHAADDEHAAGDEPAAGDVDPHWWQDPRNAIRAVGAIGDALAAGDPGAADAHRAAAERYAARIRRLDAAVQRCIAEVPQDRRKLVTTHDSLGYYADRYGIEVIGAVIPSLSTQAQASAGETAALVETIRREGVRAIFAESSVGAEVERAIARDAGARIGDPLSSDTLGPPGSPGATYLGSLAANTRALVEGFTGEPANCELPV